MERESNAFAIYYPFGQARSSNAYRAHLEAVVLIAFVLSYLRLTQLTMPSSLRYNGAALVQVLHTQSPASKRPPLPQPTLTGPSSHVPATNGAGPSNVKPALPAVPARPGD